MKKISCKTCKTYDCFIQRNLSEKWIEKIDSIKNQAWYKKKQFIIKHGDAVAGIFFIAQGNVKVLASEIQNRQQIVRFASNGHVLGYYTQINDVHTINAVAMSPSLICFLDNKILLEAFMQNPQFATALMMYYSLKLRKMELMILYLEHMSVREKIAYALLYIKRTFGTNHEDGSLNLISGRNEIADLTGTNADQVTKHLKNFADEKLIAKLKRRIKLINTKGLEKIIQRFNTDELYRQQ